MKYANDFVVFYFDEVFDDIMVCGFMCMEVMVKEDSILVCHYNLPTFILL